MKLGTWVLSKLGREELARVSTQRAGELRKGMPVVCNGYFGKLQRWDSEQATIELVCYTAGTRESGYDYSSRGTKIKVGLDAFRAATEAETLEYH